MTTYDPALFACGRVVGSRLDEFILDESYMDLADTRIPIDATSVVIADGYTVGSAGELSLDPTIGTVQYYDLVAGDIEVGSLPLAVGDRYEVTYDNVIQFSGRVSLISVDVKPRDLGKHERRITYTVASLEAELLGASVFWETLPAESALVRLRRWFTVDTSAVTTAHLPALSVTVEADDSGFGASTLLEQARRFSSATGLPVRLLDPSDPAATLSLAVFDTANDWADSLVTASPGLTVSEEWTTFVRFANKTGSADVLPESVIVVPDDMRLAGGALDIAATTTALLDTSFYLDSSYMGDSGFVQVGFLSGMGVDVFGTVMVASRVTQSFTPKRYTAQLELAQPLRIEV